MKAVHAEIGSVISATHRLEDLVPAYHSTLDTLTEQLSLSAKGNELQVTAEVTRLQAVLAKVEGRMEDDGYYESEEAQYDLDELAENLQGFAPPFCSFGAHEGDGADFGFWWSRESFDDAVADGSVIKVDDTDGWEERVDELEGVEFLAQVSDHGNVELYSVLRKDDGSVYFENRYGIV